MRFRCHSIFLIQVAIFLPCLMKITMIEYCDARHFGGFGVTDVASKMRLDYFALRFENYQEENSRAFH